VVGVKILDNQDNFFDDEAREWLEALDDLVKTGSSDKASFILSKLAERLTQQGKIPTFNLTTPFRNTIPISEEARMPGELFMER